MGHPLAEAGTSLAEGGDPVVEVRELSAHTIEGTQDVTAETVLIMDDEPEA